MYDTYMCHLIDSTSFLMAHKLTVCLVIDGTLNSMKYHKNNLFVLSMIRALFLICHSVCSFYRLYAVGGRDGSSCLKSVECFDPHTNKWTLCAQMSKRRGGVGVTTWNGLLYAIGGHDAPASNLTSRLSDCVER